MSDLLTASVGPYELGLLSERLRSVVRAGEITRVPGAPAAVKGLLHWQGEIVPVLDLHYLMGLQTQPSSSTGSGAGIDPAALRARILILACPPDQSPAWLGLWVDRVGELITITERPQPAAVASRPGPDPALWLGVIETEGRRVWVPDLDVLPSRVRPVEPVTD